MLTSSAGATNKHRRGITLLEMLIVVALISLLVGMSYTPVSSGLETLRLRAASDVVVTFLSAALDRADRRQAVVEVQILPVDNVLLARTADQAFVKRMDLPDGVRIVRVLPEIPAADPRMVRRFLIYPGGSVPRIGVELANNKGRHRLVNLDPITGTARAQEIVVAEASK
ncbi:MAG: prepilin-type N-terminal cleavage/methylation domain-containing protein [Acidobacteriota bacterium]